MKVFYFSASGNSMYVAKSLGGEAVSIPSVMKKGSPEVRDDAVGIVCPVYFGDVPKMVRKFIQEAKIETDYLFVLITYGFNPSSALQMADRRLKEAGLHSDYISKILMVDNFVNEFEVGAELKKKSSEKIDAQITAIRADLDARKKKPLGFSFSASVAGPVMRKLGVKGIADDKAQSYLVNDNCVHCGICAKVCPADNITVNGSKPVFSNHCEVCYACVHNCPKNAIHVKEEKSGLRFRNEHVKITDLIAANNT